MHPNPAFRRTGREAAIAAARAHGIGVLGVNGASGPLAAHVPFLLAADGSVVGAHLARSNPILAMLDAPQPALLSVTLGAAYVSPDWYGVEDQVPTLNYIAIHLRGTLSRLGQERLRDHVDALSAHFEGRLDKTPWTSAKMNPGVLERMLRAIVPVEMAVTTIESTYKLNQNKDAAARLGAAEHVADPLIAAAMRDV